KSTGRDLFNAAWLDERLRTYGGPAPAPADVQATLQRFTAQTVADALQRAAPGAVDVLVCGGGARNPGLMHDLAACLERPVEPTAAGGVPAQWVEALAFAWLAQAVLDRTPAGRPEAIRARRRPELAPPHPP